ncbi:MAG: hypothetical protein OQJ97_06780 [Rhodospirillales bacterium]|nr:hypothetical protein [Rhodospirillales bacterium]
MRDPLAGPLSGITVHIDRIYYLVSANITGLERANRFLIIVNPFDHIVVAPDAHGNAVRLDTDIFDATSLPNPAFGFWVPGIWGIVRAWNTYFSHASFAGEFQFVK